MEHDVMLQHLEEQTVENMLQHDLLQQNNQTGSE